MLKQNVYNTNYLQYGIASAAMNVAMTKHIPSR